MMGPSSGSIKATRRPCRADPRKDGPDVGLSTTGPATPLDAALAYSSLGWSVIPVPRGSKATRVSWKPYMTHAPDETQLRAWFDGQPTNMAVVLGAVSGNLVCRDFDDPALYHLWTESHPDLARVLPTVKTHRGYHVYFKVVNPPPTRVIEGGELRGKGGCMLLPPSIHPEGTPYEWLTPPTRENLLEVDISAFWAPEFDVTEEVVKRGVKEGRNRTYTRKTTCTCKTTGRGNGQEEDWGKILSLGRDTDGHFRRAVETAIRRTLPVGYGQRHRCIFAFVRRLRSLAEYQDASPVALQPVVKAWHRRALPNIRSKAFHETWRDFLDGWARARYRVGHQRLQAVLAEVKVSGIPDIANDLYPANKRLRLLVALCAGLQRQAGAEPFFLACRAAAPLLGCSHMQVARYLRRLLADGVLGLVERGGGPKNRRRASRYRYRVQVSDAPNSKPTEVQR